MSKRKAAGDLTGGSGDVNPQWFNLSTVQASADANTTTAFALPVQRLNNKTGKSLVMEILRICWDLPLYEPPAASTFSSYGFLSTKDPGLPQPATSISLNTAVQIRKAGTTLDYIARTIQTGVSNSATAIYDEPVYHDVQDGAGHGVLVATDTIYLSIATAVASSTATGQFNNITARLLYRWKEVSLQEYIGIVQSQSQ